MRGIFCVFAVLMLSACTGRNELVLEPAGQENEAEQTPDAASADGRAEQTPDAASAEGQLVQTPGAVSADGQTVQNPVAAGTGSQAVENPGAEPGSGLESSAAMVQPEIYVHICGAVKKPGVYALEAGSRVYQGIEAAGGFAENACEDFINQAGVLADGQRLVVPTEEEAEAVKADDSYREIWQTGMRENAGGSGMAAGTGSVADTGTAVGSAAESAGSAGSLGALVNINTATESELSSISGIGAGKAAAIVKYRQENGEFASIEDIMKVSGIKQGTFEKIKDKITVN